MPERQHTPGDVDAGADPARSGASTATDARRTDSPRGDALFAPSVAPEPVAGAEPPAAQATSPSPVEPAAQSPADAAPVDTPDDAEATTAMPASGAARKPSPTKRADATETATVASASTATPAEGSPAAAPATEAFGTGIAAAGRAPATAPDGPATGSAAPSGAAATGPSAPTGQAAQVTAAPPAGPAAPTSAGASTGPAAPTSQSGVTSAAVPPPGQAVSTGQTAPAGPAAPTSAAVPTGPAASTGQTAPTGAAAPAAPAAPSEQGAATDAEATAAISDGPTATAAPSTDAEATTAAGPTAGPTGTPAQGTPAFDADDQPTAVHAAVTPSAEDTQIIPRAAVAAPVPDQPTRPNGRGPAGDPPTEQIPVTRGGPPPVPPQQRPTPTGGGDAPKGKRRKPLLIVAGLVALLAVLYVADLVLSTGNVPRGVTVAGLQLGGLSKADAGERLRAEIEPRATQPVQVTAGEVESQIDPVAAGLEIDYQATIEQAGAQPLNPITRVTSFFTQREVGVVNKADERSVLTALEQVKPAVDKAPVEGTVRFEGATPIAVPPVPGQELDLQAAVGVLERDWASGAPVALPLIPQATVTTDEDVQQALQSVATPAVSAPVTIQGEGATATLAPTDIAGALSFRADAAANPKLVPEINNEALKEVATPQLASTERPGRDATLDFSTGAPVVVPSQDGRGVDYDKTFESLVTALTAQGPRTVTAVYADQPAKLTTEQLGALGITGEISSFTTGGFAADSGRNIRRAAEQVNGTIVQPGETFSLNALTNPRNAANGYVEAGIIENGHSARGVGGGVSQVATTLYNAAYFAGMVDVEHKEHSFYISRYPAAREATVFDDIIDLKFRNDGPTGVLIQTIWTPQNLTVKMFGTKRYEVTSATGPRTNPTEPQTLTLPAGPSCVPGRGSQGFTTTDTRTMRNLETGEVTSKTRTVRYNPVPTVVCQ